MISTMSATIRNVVRCSGPSASQQVVLGGADEARGQAAERVRQRGPLRHGGQRHPRQRHADDEPGDDRAATIQHVMDDRRARPR